MSIKLSLSTLIETPADIFFLIANIIVIICTFLIILAIFIDFVEFQKRDTVKREKKSVVETGTMFLFFFLYYALLRFKVGHMEIASDISVITMSIFGSLVIILGTYVNIKGRMNLGKNWANQIKIYDDHKFVSDGMYKYVRHPLYASLIWIFLGACLIYMNFFACVSVILIFVPSMYYRAKQEEKLLLKEFSEYKNYQMKVGMFFPRWF